ncbi:mfs multidrug transporter [Moniliophthora roreri MCA 2997]|uniref:Mfs multidrug transporter n=1 Tax=Moniliophthora roreri (strain MCA 2997) TaxID=1381753 RepID=V2X111_MONRO|nr:mfs multidrug transporter [Moniliophthora roreri MCA 2997]
MTLTKSLRLSLASKLDTDVNGYEDDIAGEDSNANDRSSSYGGGTGIPVFRSFSISDIWNRNADCETPTNERPPIPSLIQPSGEVYYATPLPFLSMVVLSITMLSEFLSANVSAPFMLFMVKGFGVGTDDADVAFWTGVLVSVFFLTQFLTSLLWATLAEKYSPRMVLFVCLMGSAVSTIVFGAAKSLPVASMARLAQGVFAGSIGVAKSSVGVITDSSNEGRAYAILGFCWGFGSVAGAVVGGIFERPAIKWPGIFGSIPLFVDFPYILPCAVAASVMVLGAFLTCFLGPDVGPRQGRDSLLVEKAFIPLPDDPAPSTNPNRASSAVSVKHLSRKLSGYFNEPTVEESTPLIPPQLAPRPISNYSTVNPRQGYPLDRTQTMTIDSTRSSRGRSRFFSGSFGRRSARDAHISGIVRPRGRSIVSYVSTTDNDTERGDDAGNGNRRLSRYASDLSLLHRMVLANENLVRGGIADLWVAAAISMEGDGDQERFEYDGDDEAVDVFTEGDETEAEADAVVEDDNDENRNNEDRGRRVSFSTATDTPSRNRARSSSTSAAPLQNTPSRLARPFFGRQTSDVNTPTPVPVSPVFNRIEAPERFFPRSDTIESNMSNFRAVIGEPALPPILETRRLSNFEPVYPPLETVHGDDADLAASALVKGKEAVPSLMSEIPLLVIVQYGLLALHSTTHDQVFMSYLVSNYNTGGLNLNAGHFAQLIATMCLFQIFYQFYLYPNVGPPRGPFSHLTMFQVGCLLFIPSYVSAIFLRSMASPDGHGDGLLMIALTGGTAIRYCGSTFGYTAISILLNYMTPVHAIGYANGIAQSVVSLARFIGPIFGGWLWSYSVQTDPSGYYLGFVVCSVICGLAVLGSLTIR